MQTRYYFFIGTKAELIKLFPLLQIFLNQKLPFNIIASGQNNLLDDEIFINLKLKSLTIFLSKVKIKKTAIGLLTWWLTTFFSSFSILRSTSFAKNKNKILIVHGDTVSTVMGAFIAKIHHARLAHIEAGLRSFQLFSPFPEEIDRLLVSNLADLHFCPNSWAIGNLKKSHGLKINTFNNTLIDSLREILPTIKDTALIKQLKDQTYYIFVLHRQENLANLDFISKILQLIHEETRPQQKCLFIVHENTRFVLEKNKLFQNLENNPNCLIVDRLPYGELMKLIDLSQFLITDGGSNQEESFYLGKPCCLLRTQTERIEGLDSNVVLSGNDFLKIKNFFINYKNFSCAKVMSKKSPSQIIFEELHNG